METKISPNADFLNAVSREANELSAHDPSGATALAMMAGMTVNVVAHMQVGEWVTVSEIVDRAQLDSELCEAVERIGPRLDAIAKQAYQMK